MNAAPYILTCWRNCTNAAFAEARDTRIERLKTELALLKAQRLGMQAEMNRLTFENFIAEGGEKAEAARALLDADQRKLNELNARVAPLQA